MQQVRGKKTRERRKKSLAQSVPYHYITFYYIYCIFFTILYYTILYYIVLQYIMLYYALLYCTYIIEGSLEVKLPTIWTDGKAEVGRFREEKKRSEKIREEKE